jgi:hypothetical protein
VGLANDSQVCPAGCHSSRRNQDDLVSPFAQFVDILAEDSNSLEIEAVTVGNDTAANLDDDSFNM